MKSRTSVKMQELSLRSLQNSQSTTRQGPLNNGMQCIVQANPGTYVFVGPSGLIRLPHVNTCLDSITGITKQATSTACLTRVCKRDRHSTQLRALQFNTECDKGPESRARQIRL